MAFPDAYAHQLCEVETPQDGLCPGLPACVPPEKGDCMAVVTGLLCGQPVRWEVVFDIKPYLNGREREEKVHEDLWNETFHHLAGRSILRNFEHMAEKKSEIEHGEPDGVCSISVDVMVHSVYVQCLSL